MPRGHILERETAQSCDRGFAREVIVEPATQLSAGRTRIARRTAVAAGAYGLKAQLTAPSALHRPEAAHEVEAGRKDQRHAIAGAHARADETGRDRACLLVKLAVGDALVVVSKGKRLGIASPRVRARTASSVSVLESIGDGGHGLENALSYNARTLPRARGRSHMSAVPQGHPDRVGLSPKVRRLSRHTSLPETILRELTPRAVIVGTILGMIFGASSLYLVLKVGLTVSASIPVAVISITLFRILSKMGARNATILENNIVQTAGSAGESIAFGVGVTMPAILILGFDLEITRVMLVAVLGGLLGILMMIPLRRALIVAQHGILKYPEGTACAEVLKAGASDESRAAASEAGQARAGSARRRQHEREDHLHRLRHRPRLQDRDGRVPRAGRTRRTKVFGRPVQRRVGRRRSLAGAARRRLHHRSAHRRDHVRGRRARVPRAHPDDQVLRRRAGRRRWRPRRRR